MLLRALLLCALLIGGSIGLAFSAWQEWQLNPLLRHAEVYELPASGGDTHSHDPSPAIPVAVTTLLANALVWSVFALFVLTLMTLHAYTGRPAPKPIHGIGWGLALLACVTLAPWLAGMPPEIPGVERAPVAGRQFWWLFCALATAGGLALLYYARRFLRWTGLILASLPYWLPLLFPLRPPPGAFANPDPAAQAVLAEIAEQFAIYSGLGMLFACLALGPACAWLTRRHLAPLARPGHPHER